MGITRVAKSMPAEIELRLPILRAKHPALFDFLMSNVGPARTTFIRDTLEAALTGRLVPPEQSRPAPPASVVTPVAPPLPAPTPVAMGGAGEGPSELSDQAAKRAALLNLNFS